MAVWSGDLPSSLMAMFLILGQDCAGGKGSKKYINMAFAETTSNRQVQEAAILQ